MAIAAGARKMAAGPGSKGGICAPSRQSLRKFVRRFGELGLGYGACCCITLANGSPMTT